MSASLALAGAVAGCAGPSTDSVGAPHEPLDLVQRVTGGANARDPLPIVIAMPGRGDTAARFASVFDGFGARARIVVLRGPIDEGRSDAWFTFRPTRTWRHVVEDLDVLAERVLATVTRIRARHGALGLPIVMGFSQGAMLAYHLAVVHPRQVRGALPVSGVFVEQALRTHRPDPAHTPRIVALHGRRDRIISIESDRESIAALARVGIRVELHENDATHWIDDATRRALHAQLAAMLQRD